MPLDVGPLEVHRDVPEPDAQTDEEEPGGDGEPGASRVDHESHREQADERQSHPGRDGPCRTDPVGHPAGERQTGHRPDAGGEEGDTELARGEPERRLGVRDP